MSDPGHLLSDPNASDLDRLLLEAWQDERPPADGRAKTLAALGLGSSAATVGALTSGGLASAGSIAPKAAATAGMLKWLFLAGFVASMGTAAFLYARPFSLEVQPQTTTAPPGTAMLPARPPVATDDAPLSAANATPVPVPALPATAAVAKASVKRADESDSLGNQIAAIDGARRALAAGDADHAEELAKSYQTRFPDGTFLEEAETLRIEALVKNGERAKAQVLGASFLRAHPASLYAPKVRSLVGDRP